MGNNINRLFPPIFQKLILQLISEAGNLSTNTSILAKGEHFILGLKNGYLFPVLCRMKEVPTIINNFTLTLSFTTDQREWNSKKTYLLLNNELFIEYLSSNCLTLLSLTKSYISNNQSNAINYFPGLSVDVHTNPTGALLTYSPLHLESIHINRNYIYIYTNRTINTSNS